MQGMISEFSVPEDADSSSPIYQFQWLYVNGLLGVIFSIGLLYTALRTRRARSWLYGISWSLFLPFYFRSVMLYLKLNVACCAI
jgi:hypothetical protein